MPHSIIGSIADFESKLSPEHGKFKRFFLSARGTVKTLLKYEASVHVVRDSQGDIDFSATFKLALKKLFAEGTGVPNLSLFLEHTKGPGKLIVSAIDGDVLTVMLPMWLADP